MSLARRRKERVDSGEYSDASYEDDNHVNSGDDDDGDSEYGSAEHSGSDLSERESGDGQVNLDESNVTPTTPDTESFPAPTSTLQKTRKRKSSSQIEDKIAQTFNTFAQTFNILRRLLETNNKKEDDCDLYAKLLARKLRQYSSGDRLILMFEIDGMLLKNPPQNQTLSYSTTHSPQYQTSPYSSTHSPQYQMSPYSSTISPTYHPMVISQARQIQPLYINTVHTSQTLSDNTSIQRNPHKRQRIPPDHTIEILSKTIIPSHNQTINNVQDGSENVVKQAYEIALISEEDYCQSPQ